MDVIEGGVYERPLIVIRFTKVPFTLSGLINNLLKINKFLLF